MKKIKIIFWASVVVFVFIIAQMFVPPVQELISGPLFLFPFIIFTLLGVALVVLTRRLKPAATNLKQKQYMYITGAGAAGVFVFVFLHNAFYALAEITSHIVALSYLLTALSVTSFFLAIIICPLAYLIGATIVIINLIKKK